MTTRPNTTRLIQALTEAGIIGDPDLVTSVTIELRAGEFPRVVVQIVPDHRVLPVVPAIKAILDSEERV